MIFLSKYTPDLEENVVVNKTITIMHFRDNARKCSRFLLRLLKSDTTVNPTRFSDLRNTFFPPPSPHFDVHLFCFCSEKLLPPRLSLISTKWFLNYLDPSHSSCPTDDIP